MGILTRELSLTEATSAMAIRFTSKPGLVAYLTAGDPDLATTHAIALAAIDAGADVLELGVPFSDPLADGPVIQRASERALVHGTSLRDVLALAADLRRERPQTGLVIFSYYNPILRFGQEAFCSAAEKAGVDGVLVTDMIVEEAADHLDALHRHHLAPDFSRCAYQPRRTPRKNLPCSQGFIYAISRTGITGTQKSMTTDAEQLVKRLRRFTQLPIAVGFGISNPGPFRRGWRVCRCSGDRQRYRRHHRASRSRRGSQFHRAIYPGPAGRGA